MQVYGAVTMNNTLCLGLFLLVVAKQQLDWVPSPSSPFLFCKRIPLTLVIFLPRSLKHSIKWIITSLSLTPAYKCPNIG